MENNVLLLTLTLLLIICSTKQSKYMDTFLKSILYLSKYMTIKFVFPPLRSVSLYLNSGVSCTAGGDAGDHQAAGGGPVSGPTPQRSVRSWAQRLQANERGPQKESCGIPAENPKGIIMPVKLMKAKFYTRNSCKISQRFFFFFNLFCSWPSNLLESLFRSDQNPLWNNTFVWFFYFL